jgi:hypothetical protein
MAESDGLLVACPQCHAGRWPLVERPQGGKIPARLFFAVPNAIARIWTASRFVSSSAHNRFAR